ncbi:MULTISPECIES: RNA-binding S4 domain-containing protein [unclassified Tsukamurella]|uniref:RNA-binding S4 domain-containing protein n=1 Tax=unclassified Tsukamurella TaxID=2633480 RepID=UPI0031BA6969
MTNPIDVSIRDEAIQLGQFLKLSGLVDSGSDAKFLIADERVRVNDAMETRRGRRLVPGDVVSLLGREARVVQSDDGAVPEADDDVTPVPPAPEKKKRRWRR